MSGVVLPTTDGGTLSRVAMGFEENWEENLAPDDTPAAERATKLSGQG